MNKTIKARKEYLKEIKNRKIMTLEEGEIVLDMFKNHYTIINGDAPISELRNITISLEKSGNDFCFYVLCELNGEPKRFISGYQFIAGTKRTEKYQLGRDLRILIQPDIDKFKENQKSLGYETYGMDADHIYPFNNIVKDFLKMKNLKYSDIKIQNRILISPLNIQEDWIEYHNSVAKYQLLTKEENRKKSDKLDYEIKCSKKKI